MILDTWRCGATAAATTTTTMLPSAKAEARQKTCFTNQFFVKQLSKIQVIRTLDTTYWRIPLVSTELDDTLR